MPEIYRSPTTPLAADLAARLLGRHGEGAADAARLLVLEALDADDGSETMAIALEAFCLLAAQRS